MADFQEVSYNCPKCGVQVFAFGALVGVVCLKCNNVDHWNPTMEKVAAAISKAKDKNEALEILSFVLQQNGIYDKFMELYGPHLSALREVQSDDKDHDKGNNLNDS